MADRYVVVDEQTHTIVGGTYLWDGQAEWTPPVAGTLLPELDAQEQGYAWPAQPEAEPVVKKPVSDEGGVE